MLTNEKMQGYTTRLQEEKKKLIAEIAEHEKVTSFGEDVVDPDEEMDEAEEIVNNLSVAKALRDRVNEIDAALVHIATGMFGICENCNQPISDDALEASPARKLCKKCTQASQPAA